LIFAGIAELPAAYIDRVNIILCRDEVPNRVSVAPWYSTEQSYFLGLLPCLRL
jgi:hypothetical protein